MSFRRLGLEIELDEAEARRRYDEGYIARCAQHQQSYVAFLEERVDKIAVRDRRESAESEVLDELRGQLREERTCLRWLQVTPIAFRADTVAPALW